VIIESTMSLINGFIKEHKRCNQLIELILCVINSLQYSSICFCFYLIHIYRCSTFKSVESSHQTLYGSFLFEFRTPLVATVTPSVMSDSKAASAASAAASEGGEEKLSKNELKRRQKAAQKAAEKEKKVFLSFVNSHLTFCSNELFNTYNKY